MNLKNDIWRYEFAETIFVFCAKDIYVFSSAKKGIHSRTHSPNKSIFHSIVITWNLISFIPAVAILETMKEEESALSLHFLTINKAENDKHYDTIISSIKQSKNGVNTSSPLPSLQLFVSHLKF